MNGFLKLGKNDFDGNFTGLPPVIPSEEKDVLIIGTEVLVLGTNSNVLTIE